MLVLPGVLNLTEFEALVNHLAEVNGCKEHLNMSPNIGILFEEAVEDSYDANHDDVITPAAFAALVLRHQLLVDDSGRPQFGSADNLNRSTRRLQRGTSVPPGTKDPRVYSQALQGV